MLYEKIQVPAAGEPITVNADGSLNVPERPIIPSSRATAPAWTSRR